MKKLIAIFMILLSINLYAIDNSAAILKEIQSLREDMNKRFEQIDKRFEFIQKILYMLMGLIFVSPFIAIYLRDKKDAQERKSLRAASLL